MTARLAMMAGLAASFVAMAPHANARPGRTVTDHASAALRFTSLTRPDDHGHSRYMLISDLPETYDTVEEHGVQVRWKLNKVKVKVPFALSY